jgi:UDP-N-acetylmuramoyl-L-alanyl-D-glutamate--2,6-diaminopimelate ligase
MLLSKALEGMPGISTTGTPDVEIGGISYDSRSVQEGDLFVAIKGEKSDGARFIPQAIERGAAAVASEKPIEPGENTVSVLVPDARMFLAEMSGVFYGHPSEKLDLVAITGTNGKTTTSYLMDSIFRHAGIRACLVGTIGMKIGTRSFLSSHTTPESSDLTRFLKDAATQGCTHGALEVSSHSLSLKRVFGTRFRVGIFMNLTQDHLDFHKNIFRPRNSSFPILTETGLNRPLSIRTILTANVWRMKSAATSSALDLVKMRRSMY